MGYRVRQRFWTLGRRYVVLDEDGVLCFVAESPRGFSLGNRLVLRDAENRAVLTIEQTMPSLAATYHILRDGEDIAIVRQHALTLMAERFSIEVTGDATLEVDRSILALRCTIRRGDQVVARVRRLWLSFRDHFTVDIEEGEDDAFILASALCLVLTGAASLT